MGKLRDQAGRYVAARGTSIACSLVLASTLLAGCHQAASGSSAQSSSPSQTVAVAPASSVTTQAPSATTQTTSATPANKTADVSWAAPTSNTDGSALTNLAGYRIYYGTSANALSQSVDVPNAGATDYVVQGLTQGTWYFAVAAYTNTGLQSSFSSVVSKTIT